MSKDLREEAGVSEECMNRVYDALRILDAEHLGRMWGAANPETPMGRLLRWQIFYTVEVLIPRDRKAGE